MNLSTVRSLTDTEIHDHTEILSRQDFETSIKEYIGSFDPTLIADIPVDDLEAPILTSTPLRQQLPMRTFFPMDRIRSLMPLLSCLEGTALSSARLKQGNIER